MRLIFLERISLYKIYVVGKLLQGMRIFFSLRACMPCAYMCARRWMCVSVCLRWTAKKMK